MPVPVLAVCLGVYLLWNVAVFALYAADNQNARHHAWRIREWTLLLCAFFLGALGALAGVFLLRHKTQHRKFTLLVPLFLIPNGLALCGLFYLYASWAGLAG